jgi:S-DNA-T family DNA segregation ATPase FtsK/SpoIIIE
MDSKEEIKSLALQVKELTESLEKLGEKQNSQYTDVMLLLKKIDDKLNEFRVMDNNIEIISDDELYAKAKEVVIESGKASTSYLQRKLSIGYSYACRLMDKLENEGIVGASRGSKPREVFVQKSK